MAELPGVGLPNVANSEVAPQAPSTRVVALDIGRHRLYTSASSTSASSTSAGLAETSPPVGQTSEGLLLRWFGDSETNRFSDKIISLTDTALIDTALIDTALTDGTMGRALYSRAAASIVADVIDLAAEQTQGAAGLTIAIPPSFGASCRAAVVAGARQSGFADDCVDLIERPIAAAAGWLAHRAQLGRDVVEAARASESGSSFDHGPVLVIDNDGGELSVVALHPASRRLLVCEPLSIGPKDDPKLVAERLVQVVSRAVRLSWDAQNSLVFADDWATLSSAIAQVVVTGSGARNPEFVDLVSAVLPAAHLMPDPVVPPERCVSVGLGELRQFEDWSACWPTRHINISGDQGTGLEVVEVADSRTEIPVTEARALAFDQAEVEVDAEQGLGIRIPASLRSCTIKLLDDGRVLLLGPRGTRPLCLAIAWPFPGSGTNTLKIKSCGRRKATVTTPEEVTRG